MILDYTSISIGDIQKQNRPSFKQSPCSYMDGKNTTQTNVNASCIITYNNKQFPLLVYCILNYSPQYNVVLLSVFMSVFDFVSSCSLSALFSPLSLFYTSLYLQSTRYTLQCLCQLREYCLYWKYYSYEKYQIKQVCIFCQSPVHGQEDRVETWRNLPNYLPTMYYFNSSRRCLTMCTYIIRPSHSVNFCVLTYPITCFMTILGDTWPSVDTEWGLCVLWCPPASQIDPPIPDHKWGQRRWTPDSGQSVWFTALATVIQGEQPSLLLTSKGGNHFF